MTRAEVQRWLDAYIEAWRTSDAGAIGSLFAADASYRYRPSGEPVVGRAAIVAHWLKDPDDPPNWASRYEPYAVDGDRAVAVGESWYVNADGTERERYFNLWVLRFDADGRCVEFAEWTA